MKLKFAKAAVVVTIAAAASLAVPTAAQGYGVTPGCSTDSATVAAGSTFSFGCAAGAFAPGETVSLSVTGEGAAGSSLAMVKFAPVTQALGSVTSNTQGGIAVGVRLAPTATGVQTVLATSPSNPTGSAVSITAAATGGGGAGGGGTPGTGGRGSGTLPATGVNSAEMLGMWTAGGALVLLGGGFAVAAAVRRNRKLAAGS